MKTYRTLTGLCLILGMFTSMAQAQLTNNGATIVIQAGATLVVEGAIVNRIDWPAQAPYGTALDDAVVTSSDGEPVEVGIVIPPMTMTCLPGPSGPTYHSGAATQAAAPIPAFIKFVRRGQTNFVPVDLLLEVLNNEPPAGDRQVIDTEILSMRLTMQQGNHPYFTNVSCVAKSGGTGRTLVRAAGAGADGADQFLVDSFFDVFVELSASGAAGTPFEGMHIDAEFPVRLRQVLDVFDGLRFESIGEADVLDDGVCLSIDNLGSSGENGVRFGSKKGYDYYKSSSSLSIAPPSGAGGLLADGEMIGFYPHPPPPEPDFPDLPDLPARSIVCTNTGGTVAAICSSNAVRASEWIVEVWDGGVLRASGTAADASACWSMPAAGFRPIKLRCAGTTRRGNPAMSTAIGFETPVEITISGATGPVVGDAVVVSPRDPKLLIPGVGEVEIRCSCTHLCIAEVEVGMFGVEHRGLGNAWVRTRGRSMLVDNLGSSGYDGVSVAGCGGPPHDNDCDGIALPYHAGLDPIDIEASGASFFVSSLDANGGNVASAEYRGGGGAGGGGRIFVDYNTASTVCRVSVLNNGVPVGEFDVAITANTKTEVCAITAAAMGEPLLTGCGKLRIGWPWELSCLVEEFDRDVMITPTGGTGMLGDEVRLLAPGATAAEVQSIRSLQLRASGIPQFVICSESSGPFLPSPVMPPSAATEWQFPGQGLSLVQASNSYYAWDPVADTAVCVNKQVRDFSLVSQNGNRRTYSATMDVHIEGVGGLVYSKDFVLPGSVTIEYGANPFIGEQVQQYAIQLLDYSFALPQGSDPDIRTLRVRAGSDHGFPSPGDVVTRKIPECELEIQAILDILADFTLEGSQGGPLVGGAVHTAAHEAAHVIQQGGGISGGVAFTPMGAASASSTDNVLMVSNIGSSGEDGVSIELPAVESIGIEFSDLAPVELMPGGHLRFTPRGVSPGAIAGIAVGVVSVTHSSPPDPSAFYDIVLDAANLSPTGTSIEIYAAGRKVATMPGGATIAAVEAHPLNGNVLPAIKGCGKLSGRSASPCDFIRFSSPVIFRNNGQPDATGDEVRLLIHGVPIVSVSSLQLNFSATKGEVKIGELAYGLTGRDIVTDGATRATDHNSSRSNKTSHNPIAFDPDPDDDNDLDIDGVIEIRVPPSALSPAPGGGRLWPMSGYFRASTVTFESPGARMTFEACGKINGKAGTSYGVLEACSDGEKFLLKGDFTSRGNSQ
ncbi:MAG: hypothetical protein ACI9NC_005103, partial [Verrucomicrobiales bacterium]